MNEVVSALAAATAVKAVVTVAEAANVKAVAMVAAAVSAAEVDVAVSVEMKAVAIVHRAGSNAVSNAMIHAVRAAVVSAQPAREKLLTVHRVKADEKVAVKADAENVAAEAVVIVLSVVSAHHAAMQRLHPTLPLLKT